MIDEDGYLWRGVLETATHASAEEIETEIRAQVERAISRGIRPSHIDTHMGTLYARLDYTKAYLKVAEEYHIPAMVIEPTPEVIAKFRKKGYPITQTSHRRNGRATSCRSSTTSTPRSTATSYDDKKEKFYELVLSLSPGLNEIIFHPSVETEGLKHITGSWQQRSWEAQMFSDPEVLAFLEREGVLFTNWKEIMKRFDAKNPPKTEAK